MIVPGNRSHELAATRVLHEPRGNGDPTIDGPQPLRGRLARSGVALFAGP